jgi:FkbM family methyltransferase
MSGTSVNTSSKTTLADKVTVRSFFRALFKKTLGLLPPGLIVFLYTKAFHARLVRGMVNACLRFIIPPFIDTKEGRLFLNNHDPVVSGAIALGVYEPYFSELFRSALRTNMVVVDVGANLGYYSLMASKKSAVVIAFEPEQQNLVYLKQSIDFNKRNNVVVLDYALGDKTDTETLFIDPYNKGRHSFLPDDKAEKATVKVTTLDAALLKLGVKKVSLIKIDIEGWEAKALIGMKMILKKDRPLLFFEFVPDRITKSGENPMEMLESLIKLGYKLDVIDEDKQRIVPIGNLPEFVNSITGTDAFTNLIGYIDLPGGL